MSPLIRLIISTLAVFATDYLLSGVHINQFTTAILVAIVLALLNTFLRPLLLILTIPITVVTLGLFYLVINAFLVVLASSIVPGFRVDSFGDAILFSLLNAFIAWVMQQLAKNNEDDARQS